MTYENGVQDTAKRFVEAVIKHRGFFKNPAIIAVLDLAIEIQEEIEKKCRTNPH